MTLLFSDPIFLEHDTGSHPETAERLRVIGQHLAARKLDTLCTKGAFQPLEPREILNVHDEAVIQHARELCEQGGGYLDADTILSAASYRVALAAAGACVAATHAVLEGEDNSALCLVRPPGHHATPDRSMGFCIFNNAALAARAAQKRFGLSRILVVDWDVHHGNGTQDIFYNDGAVHFLSIHRYGEGFYPGTGSSHETGTGPGLGAIRNIPIRFGARPKAYLDLFQEGLENLADRCRPELVILSAGFDAHHLDPIGGLGLDDEHFLQLSRSVMSVAQTYCRGRIVSCLEGGYDWQATAECVAVHLRAMIEENSP